MGTARLIAVAPLALAFFAAGALAQVNDPGCPQGGYGVASCPKYGTKSEWEAAKHPDAEPPPQYDSKNDCLKAGWGIAQCQGFEAWWKKGESVETAPNPDQHQGCAGFGTTECPPGGGGGGENPQATGQGK